MYVNGTQIGSPISVSATTNDIITYSSDITASGSVVLKIASTGSGQVKVDDINWTSNTVPALTVSTTALTGFTYLYGSGPSSEQTFTISGGNLTNDVSIAAPTNYEISKTSGSGYTTPLTYTIAEVASPQTIYVRLKAGLGINTYNSETITASSANASNKTVTCSGSVTAPPAPAAPVAIAGTAVGSNGFTANWDASSDATGYRLDVYTQNTSPTTLTEGFDGGATAPSGWTFTGITNIYTSATNFGQSSPSISFNDLNDRIVTPTVTSPSSLSFWIKGQGTNAISALLVETLTGSTWSTIDNIVPIPTIAATKTYSLDSNVTRIRFTYTKDAGNLAFDDVVIVQNDLVKSYEYENQDMANATSYNVVGLNPITTYYYVVRAYDAYSQTSLNSNEITVTTEAAPVYDYPNGSTVTITGGTVTLTVGNANNSSNQTVIAVGNSNFTTSYYNVFTLIGAGPWTLTFNTTAPWGAYHRGGTWHSVQGSGSQIVMSITANKDLELPVVLGDQNPTLPVELSSFTASISAQNFVNLMWTTQSETGVSGFYIYRGTIEDASQAELISPMIQATNTSVTHTYLYTDNQLYNDGVYYYWLQNVDFDGTNSFHGPVVVNYSTGTGGPGTPVIPEVTELKGIFPNPFNPTAQISYSLKDAASVSIKVYNSRGQIVRSFDNAPGTVGNHRIVWDGRDFRGSSCSTGVYFVRMFAGKEVFTQKAVLVK